MARINVEQKALSDPRFDALARLRRYDDRDLALAKMIRIWNECIERGSYVLPCWVVEAILLDSAGPADLVAVELAEWAGEGTLRIKGTEGRIEYLEDLRDGKVRGGKARAAGASRDPKTGAFTSRKPAAASSGPAEPSAPAPAPAPSESESVSVLRNPIHPLTVNADVDDGWGLTAGGNGHGHEKPAPKKPTPKQRREAAWLLLFADWWPGCWRKVGKAEALRGWQKIGRENLGRMEPEQLLGNVTALQEWFEGHEWTHGDRSKMPHPSTWFNGQKFDDASVLEVIS